MVRLWWGLLLLSFRCWGHVPGQASNEEFLAEVADAQPYEVPKQEQDTESLSALWLASENFAEVLEAKPISVIRLPVALNIFTVGFDGTGSYGLNIPHKQLAEWLGHLDHDVPQSLLDVHSSLGADLGQAQGAPRYPPAGQNHSHMPRLLYRYKTQVINLDDKVGEVLAQLLAKHARPLDRQTVQVHPGPLVDALESLLSHLQLPQQAFSFFLLNPNNDWLPQKFPNQFTNTPDPLYGYRTGLSAEELRQARAGLQQMLPDLRAKVRTLRQERREVERESTKGGSTGGYDTSKTGLGNSLFGSKVNAEPGNNKKQQQSVEAIWNVPVGSLQAAGLGADTGQNKEGAAGGKGEVQVVSSLRAASRNWANSVLNKMANEEEAEASKAKPAPMSGLDRLLARLMTKEPEELLAALDSDFNANDGADSPTEGAHDCLVDTWLGRGRLLFLDLAAGGGREGLSWGPTVGGEGVRGSWGRPSLQALEDELEKQASIDRANRKLWEQEHAQELREQERKERLAKAGVAAEEDKEEKEEEEAALQDGSEWRDQDEDFPAEEFTPMLEELEAKHAMLAQRMQRLCSGVNYQHGVEDNLPPELQERQRELLQTCQRMEAQLKWLTQQITEEQARQADGAPPAAAGAYDESWQQRRRRLQAGNQLGTQDKRGRKREDKHDQRRDRRDRRDDWRERRDRELGPDLGAGLPLDEGEEGTGHQSKQNHTGKAELAKLQFLAQLSALVSSALRHVVTPTLADWQKSSAGFFPKVHFQLYHIRDGPAGAGRGDQAALRTGTGLAINELWGQLRRAMEQLKLPSQTFSYSSRSLQLDEDAALSAAFASALRSAMLPVLDASGAVLPRATLFLDSLLLENELLRVDREQGGKKKRDSSSLEVPVFLFEMHMAEPVFVDLDLQAQALPSMILATSNPQQNWPTQVSCNGNLLLTDLGNPSKQLAAMAARRLAGLLPLHVSLDATLGMETHNWGWEVGESPLCETTQSVQHGLVFSQAQRDTAHRSYLATALWSSVRDVNEAIATLAQQRTSLGNVVLAERTVHNLQDSSLSAKYSSKRWAGQSKAEVQRALRGQELDLLALQQSYRDVLEVINAAAHYLQSQNFHNSTGLERLLDSLELTAEHFVESCKTTVQAAKHLECRSRDYTWQQQGGVLYSLLFSAEPDASAPRQGLPALVWVLAGCLLLALVLYRLLQPPSSKTHLN